MAAVPLGGLRPYAGQAELLSTYGVDLALLPVNGRDGYRLANGVPGNFHVEEAVDLCRAAGIPELFCHHFGLFDFNSPAPRELYDRLTACAGDLVWTLPVPGTTYRLHRPETEEYR